MKLTAQTCCDPMYIAAIFMIAVVVVMEVICVYVGIFVLWGRGNKKSWFEGEIKMVECLVYAGHVLCILYALIYIITC